MKLSICIPTYNRCKYFYLMTQDLLDQIRLCKLQNEVEICISDNGSTDETWDKVNVFLNRNQDLHIKVHRFETNQGADKNFLKCFEMADGEYTILKGDDDFIKPEGLLFIFKLLYENPDVDYFLSDYDIVTPKREFLSSIIQLRDVYDNLYVDCDSEIEMRNFFTLSNGIMSMGSFISAYIIRTEALKGDYEKCFDGTFYIHMYYIWKYLLSGGKKIMYTKKKYIEQCYDGHLNSDFGFGVKRKAVDVEICVLLSKKVFNATNLCTDVKNIAQRMYPCPIYVNRDQRMDYEKKLLPSMIECGYQMQNLALHNSWFWHIAYALLSLFTLRADVTIRRKFFRKFMSPLDKLMR